MCATTSVPNSITSLWRFQPDRNGDANRLVDHHGKARYQRSRSEFYTPVFPFPVKDACGPRDSRRRTRKATASGAARLEQHMVEQLTAAAAHPALGDTILPRTLERGPHSVYLQRSNGCRDLRPAFCISILD